MTESSPNRPVRISVLGSTGSVGTQTLDVVAEHPARFQVVALAARHDTPLLREQVATYRPALVALKHPPAADFPIPDGTEVLSGDSGLTAAATHADADIVVVATSGHDAIMPTIQAIKAGKIIAMANKETLVCAGEIIMPLVRASGQPLRPVDSEHSAIWQALQGASERDISRLLITASGGPFRALDPAALQEVTAAQALAHPTWSMGGKITIDSATLMNKGLEVIEAHHLFSLPYERIEVVVHPESIVHSLVEFIDGSQIAQLGLPDMRTPIQYALSWPQRIERAGPRLDLVGAGALHFMPPRTEAFPCLDLCRQAGLSGNTYPTVLSAVDDVAVEAFRDGRIGFMDIPAAIAAVLEAHTPDGPLSLEGILAADAWARAAAAEHLARNPRQA